MHYVRSGRQERREKEAMSVIAKAVLAAYFVAATAVTAFAGTLTFQLLTGTGTLFI